MIEVNLLPEDRRPVERTPLPRFLTILAGVLGFSLEGLVLVFILADYPQKREVLKNIQVRIDTAQEAIDQIQDLDNRIGEFKRRNQSVVQLYDRRRTWAPLLYRLSRPEVLPRNIWYREIELRKQRGTGRPGQAGGDELLLAGYARGGADDQNVSPMFQAIKAFADNLKQPHENFSEHFEGGPDVDKPSELVDLAASRDASPGAPRQAIAFGITLMLKKTKAREASTSD